MFRSCTSIPVRVIALKEEKFQTAKHEIESVAQFSDVKMWQGIRGKDLFDENTNVLPNHKEILAQKYPHAHFDLADDENILSTQAELSLSSKQRTNLYDLHNAGAIGCSLSHISLWQHMVDNDIPVMMIFEDDVLFENRFKNGTANVEKELNCILNEFSLNFDVLNLNLCPIPSVLVHGTKLTDSRLKNVVFVEGIAFRTQGYIITLEGAKQLLKNAFPLLHVIDSYMTLLTVLPSSKNHYIYLATKLPWLIHPTLEITGKSSIGYDAFTTIVDGVLFLPRWSIFAMIGVCFLSLVAAFVLAIVVICLTQKGKKIQVETKYNRKKKDKFYRSLTRF